jgi:hypothetical protein
MIASLRQLTSYWRRRGFDESRVGGMKKLVDLGFERYRNLEQGIQFQFLHRTGYAFPNSYLEFLCFRKPPSLILGYKFVGPDGHEWEGCVGEFDSIISSDGELVGIEDQLTRSSNSPNRVFLRVGSDPGGNSICIELSKPGQPVVDIDYGTGQVSEISPNFVAFLDAIYRIEES